MGMMGGQKSGWVDTAPEKNEAIARMLWPDAYAGAGTNKMQAPVFTTPEGRLILLQLMMERDDWLMFSMLKSVAINHRGTIFWIDTGYLFLPDKLRDAALGWLAGSNTGGRSV